MPAAELVPGPLAAACGQVRAAGPGDEVAGVQPSWVACPGSVDEISAVLRAAAGLNLAVVPRGTGTKLAWGLPPRRCDLVVDMLAMNQVLEHEAGDLVVRVQAGIQLSELAQVLAAAGQQLSLDPPGLSPYQPETSPHQPSGGNGAGDHDGGLGTVGGVLATGLAGPRRLRYGTPRDLAIGITVVRADGVVAHSGGKVVKNVAGYDLGKLFAGSYGTLGIIAEAAFRLHPVPAAMAWVSAEGASAATARDLIAAAADSPLAPSAAEIARPARGGPVHAAVLIEGDRHGVAERAAQLAGLLGPGAQVSAEPPAWWGRGGVAPAGGTLIRLAFWAGQLAEVLDALDRAAAAADLEPEVGGAAAAGVLHVRLAAAAGGASVAQFVGALRATPPLGGTVPDTDQPPARGSVTVLQAPPPVRAALDMWGPVPSVELMRAVKDQFDPGHRMAPGRFAGGI
jgi:glycolate oxidase FAD binding subunit